MTSGASSDCVLCSGQDRVFLFSKQGKRFVRCPSCGLVWIDPMPTADELSDYYEHSYREGRYSFFVEAQEIRRLIAEYRLKLIRDVAHRGRWLDIGCASGEFVAAASGSGSEAEGLELSADAVTQARSRGLNVYRSSVEDYCAEQIYDTITAFDLIEHLLQPRAFLTRVRSWLVPGGTLVLTLPDVGSVFPRWLMRRNWFYYWPAEHLFYFNRRTIRQLLTDQGFEVRTVARVYKPLTPRYAAATLEMFNPTLGRLAKAVVSVLPERMISRPWRMYAGEMIVIATVA